MVDDHCSPSWGSFAVGDHFESEITCGTVQISLSNTGYIILCGSVLNWPEIQTITLSHFLLSATSESTGLYINAVQ